jgi:hypothetical protein
MISISYACAPATSEKSMSSRVASDPVMAWGASDGHEIPAGLIGGKNGRGPFELGAFAETDEPLDSDAALGASGDEPAHPTTSTLANMSNSRGDFIRHLSLWLTRPVFWLVYEQEAVLLNWRAFRQRVDVQSTRRQTYCGRPRVFYGRERVKKIYDRPLARACSRAKTA